jgi:hypothetical protein
MMKTIAAFYWLLVIAGPALSQPCITVETECSGSTDYCGPYELSGGIYRIPFADGTDVTITNDHYNHCPRGRIDMVGDNGNTIVAAADGWVRWIEDDNNTQCDCSQTFCLNNYIWIEHANGEWTKYTHMQYQSVPNSIDVGDWVTAGTTLGTEGAVGCASGVHLHFEVAQPVDTNTLVFDPDGGYIDGDWAKNMIPVFCNISGNVFVDGETYPAAPCFDLCSSSITNPSGTFDVGDYDADIAGSNVSAVAVTFHAYSSGMYQAGDYVNLGVGFAAESGTDFTARIGGCNDFPERMQPENDERVFGRLTVFPNPSPDGRFTVLLPEEESGACLVIHDVKGKLMFTAHDVSGKYALNLSGRAGGIYILYVVQDDQHYVVKLIK